MKLTWTNGLLMLVAVTVICLSGTNGWAQRGGRPGGFGGFGQGGVLDIATREDVQKELELLPEQVEQLNELAEKEREGQRERIRALFSGFNRDAGEAERNAARERIQAALRESAEQTQAKVNEILLPHQAKRLSQLATQRRLRGGIGGILRSEELSGQLGISEDQREQLQDKARAAEEAFREKVAQLRQEMQADLLQVLSPSQQEKYRELVGEPFEFALEERDPFGRGGRSDGEGRGGRTRGRRPAQ